MGFAVAKRLLEERFEVFVYNRTKDKASALAEFGAFVCSNANEAVKAADCIILMLADINAINEVLFKQIDTGCLINKTIIQMGTISPKESVMLEEKLFQVKAGYLEAPVLGSRREAEDGNLIVMVGSKKEDYNEFVDVLGHLGNPLKYIGPVGKAAALKLALNQLIAGHLINFSLSLGLIEKNGIDVDIFMEILRDSALYAPMFDKKLPNWVHRSYDEPNFPTKHLLKDVRLVIEEAEGRSLFVGVAKEIERIISKAVKQGLGGQDYSSVYDVINKVDYD